MSAGRYNKQLLRGADKLDELRTLAGQVRQYFYKITLPWTDEGYRLLPANLYFDLTARMREFEASFEQGVEAFLAIYPQYIDQVRPELNGLFREEDYPKAEKLRRKFGVKLEVLPIPTGNDFRVQMSAEEQARVAREIDSNVRQSLVRGTEDLWSRLRDVVSHMVDRLNEPESRCHATMVTNVFDLVELLPRLNVTDDPGEVLRIIRQVLDRLEPGPVMVDDPKIALPPKEKVYPRMESLIHHFKLIMHGMDMPVGEIYSATEAANGELGFYIVSDGGKNPYRIRVRPPCLPIFSSFEDQVKGGLIADAVAVLGAMNVIAGELDR